MKKRIALVYPYIAHYRLPLFRELMNNDQHHYYLISAAKSGNDIKTVDQNLANLPINKGGLRWYFVKNLWFFRGLYRQPVHGNLYECGTTRGIPYGLGRA